MSEQTQKRNIMKSMKGRMLLALGLAMLFFLILLVRLVDIQVFRYDDYLGMAQMRQLKDLTISANRGTIYDANMNVLAHSATAWTVFLSPTEIPESKRETVAKALSEQLDVDYDSVMAKLAQNTSYARVKTKVDQSVADRLREWIRESDINSGIYLAEDSKRYYPYGNFLASVLGFTGTDNYGLEGIEAYYDNYLAGTPGRILTAQNAWGNTVYYEYETRHSATPGNSLVLTIDEVVQYYLEKYVEEQMIRHKVENYACGIVMNVKTGEILGMTTKPDYDPNTPLSIYSDAARAEVDALRGSDGYGTALVAAQQAQWQNKAITALYEPGSVFKVVTASAALETGTATLDSTFTCTSSRTIARGVTMRCWYSPGHGTQVFTKAFTNSCNLAFITMGQNMGSTLFYKYFDAFGLASKTGIDLPGEALSIYYTASKLGVVELASCSFGQSNAVTPLQMITAVSAAVNGGYLVQPHVVSKVIDSEGNIVKSFDTTTVRQVISEQTSANIARVMEALVTQSTSVNAYTRGYRVGGKTGTSQKLNGASDEYVSSFCGIAPVDDPQIAILLMFDTPRSGSIYGSIVASPAAGKVLKAILPYLGVDTAYNESELATADTVVVSAEGMSVANATSTLKRAGFAVKVVGDGTSVVSQFPTTGMAIPKGSTVFIYTDEGSAQTVNVPSLTGKTIANAKSILAGLGLNIRINGADTAKAVAVEQSVSGSTVNVGTVIDVEFVDYSIGD